MSQYIYENRFFSTDEMLKEYIRCVIYRKISLLGALFALLSLVMLLVTWRDGDSALMAIFGVCLFIILVVLLFSPVLTLRQVKADNQRIHNGLLFETASWYRRGDSPFPVIIIRFYSCTSSPTAGCSCSAPEMAFCLSPIASPSGIRTALKPSCGSAVPR